MNLETDVRTSQKAEGFTKKTKSVSNNITTCAMSGCTNEASRGFVVCAICRQRRLLAKIAELIPEDVEA
jgi:hypothetical protein